MRREWEKIKAAVKHPVQKENKPPVFRKWGRELKPAHCYSVKAHQEAAYAEWPAEWVLEWQDMGTVD